MAKALATILLVDDDAMNRDALSRRLERSGYKVLMAEGGVEALDIAAAEHVDLVLLDVMMPGMSGIETLARLRQTRALSELPVIMVTAKSDSHDTVEALDLGANDYITKPVDFAVAQARIRTQLTARRSDPLTGLPNRVLFMDRLDRLVQRTPNAERSSFALFFIDVDRFKVINDSLGHVIGDELLIELAQRFQRSLRTTDSVGRVGVDCTLARLGGDEFTVLLDGVATVDDARVVAERMIEVASQPISLDGREVCVSISLGILMSNRRYQNAEEMLRDADSAMYRAKHNGKGRCAVFDVSMFEAAEARLRIENDLRSAVANGELRLDYQPIVAMSGRRLAGFEALLRWQHPQMGLIAPVQFITIAEETGLIVEIGRWVLREACRQMRAWDAEFSQHTNLMINVNLSPRQCVEPEFVGEVTQVLTETGLAPERLKLEVTDSALLASELVTTTLHALHAIGVQLALDDFGTGYSALNYLRQFPFSTIKIDRSFVSDIHNTEKLDIVRAIVGLATGLSMNVTAEGIETEEQVAKLRQLDCELGQGFLFHRPLSSEMAGQLLRSDEGESFRKSA